MRVTVSQQNKKLLVTFQQGNVVDRVVKTRHRQRRLTNRRSSFYYPVDNHVIDKADEFLASLDRFIKKRKIDITVLKKANLEFVNVGLLTERIIRAIIAGLRF